MVQFCHDSISAHSSEANLTKTFETTIFGQDCVSCRVEGILCNHANVLLQLGSSKNHKHAV
jgi:hypothetical protein